MLSSVATRYAQALLKHIHHTKKAEHIQHDMQHLVALCQQQPRLLTFLQNPTIHTTQKSHLITKHITPSYHKITTHFLQLILQKGRAHHLHAIAIRFLDLYEQQQQQRTGKLITAHPLSKQTIEQLTQLAKNLLHLSHLTLYVEQQPNILGGYILQVGDYRLDASIQRKLTTLLHHWQQRP